MNNNNFETQKLNISDVLKESIKLYKDNFRLLIKISFISFIVQIISGLPYDFMSITKDPSKISFLTIIGLVLMIPAIYYSIKLYIALFVCVSERYIEREIEFSGSMEIASGKLWRFVGVGIKYLLILIIPTTGILTPFYFVNDLFVRWTIVVAVGLPTSFLFAVFGFAPLMVIAEDERRPYFSNCVRLVNGDFWRIVFLWTVVSLVFAIPYQLYAHVFNDYKSILPLEKIISSTINQMFFVFVNPFISSVYIVMYYKLKRNKRIG